MIWLVNVCQALGVVQGLFAQQYCLNISIIIIICKSDNANNRIKSFHNIASKLIRPSYCAHTVGNEAELKMITLGTEWDKRAWQFTLLFI